MRVLSVFGTRPEAIKMAPVVQALQACTEVQSVVCVTGQHRTMLEQVLSLFGLQPDHDLDVMVPDQTLNGLCSRLFERLDPVLDAVRPDLLLVHGDTSSAMVAATAAFHRRLAVGHVEAGLRTGCLDQPWPEEFNRRVVDLVSTWLFAPTRQAAHHLAAERVAGRTVVTGNTVIDALLAIDARLRQDEALCQRLDQALPALMPGRQVVLVTGHRRENFGPGFEAICQALARLAARDDVEVVYPVHLNPQVQAPVRRALGEHPRIHLVAPLDYLGFVRLMQRAAVVLTDSGGVQEEAPALGKPVLVMREVTERPEAVQAGAVTLVGTDPERIVREVARVLNGGGPVARRGLSPYGDGQASARIVAALTGRPVQEFEAGATAPGGGEPWAVGDGRRAQHA